MPLDRGTRHLAQEAGALSALAARLGLISLQRAAHGVAETARRPDTAARAATLARLRRVGIGSLAQLWEARGNGPDRRI